VPSSWAASARCSKSRSGWPSRREGEAPIPERLIDVPLESLPYVDEHGINVAASADRVWAALAEHVGGGGSGGIRDRIAGALRCVPGERRGTVPEVGATIPGFVVARSVPPAVLALLGEHRFARYALIFRISDTLAGPVRLSAETRAEFPGRSGRAYRALVIGTRGHVIGVHSILRSVRRAAEGA
jgi:hypothetical protein